MSIFPADTAQVTPDRGHRLIICIWQQQVMASSMVEMRTIRVLPAWQPAAHLFPDGQVPNHGACGQYPLREDGRKWMVSEGTPDPKPTWSHSKRMITKDTVSFYKVMWVSHATVASKCQKKPWAGSFKNLDYIPRAEVKTIQRHLAKQVLWAQGWHSARCLWPMQRFLAQVQEESQDEGDGRLSAPLTHLAAVPCLALVQHRGCTDSILALRLLI